MQEPPAAPPWLLGGGSYVTCPGLHCQLSPSPTCLSLRYISPLWLLRPLDLGLTHASTLAPPPEPVFRMHPDLTA